MPLNAAAFSLVKCSECGKHFENNDHGCPFCELAIIEENLVDARARLPEGMKHCTILFKECEKGHGRLTAKNWIDHGCSTCKIAGLQDTLDDSAKQIAVYIKETQKLQGRIKELEATLTTSENRRSELVDKLDTSYMRQQELTAQIRDLEAKLKQAGESGPAANASQIAHELRTIREQGALIRQIAAIFGYHGNRNGEELVHYLETFRRERDGFMESLNDKHAIFHQIANLALSQCQIADPPKPTPVDDEEEDGL